MLIHGLKAKMTQDLTTKSTMLETFILCPSWWTQGDARNMVMQCQAIAGEARFRQCKPGPVTCSCEQAQQSTMRSLTGSFCLWWVTFCKALHLTGNTVERN